MSQDKTLAERLREPVKIQPWREKILGQPHPWEAEAKRAEAKMQEAADALDAKDRENERLRQLVEAGYREGWTDAISVGDGVVDDDWRDSDSRAALHQP